MEKVPVQSLKRKNKKIQNEKKRDNTLNNKRKPQDIEEEDQWEDDDNEISNEQQEDDEDDEEQKYEVKPSKIKKNDGQKKSVRFQENIEDNDEERDLKTNVDKHNLKYEDEYYDEYDNEEIIDEQEVQEKQKIRPFLGTDKELQEGEELEMDNRAYETYHRAEAEWPCLSFDFLLPNKEPYYLQNPGFTQMNKYPYHSYMVSGTQSGQDKNYIYLLSMSNLHKTKYDDDSDYQNSDDENDDEDPHMRVEQIEIKHNVNRIRSMQHLPVVAYWQENGDLTIMDMKNKFFTLVEEEQKQDQNAYINKNNSLLNIKCNTKTFENTCEGFALDWSYLKQGYLLTGSCDSKIYLYQPRNNNLSDMVRQKVPFTYHNGSVEDIQWSPKDENEFASCSVDGTIQFSDIRSDNRSKSSLKINASNTDINVISWCRANPNLLASGADDGAVKVWDKRYTKNAYAEIDFHKEPITSIQFQPNEETTIAVSSADNRLTIWDFAVENDDNVENLDEDIPETLMFIHQGQKDMKELRYHPIYHEMLGCTALDGFNLFKPALDETSSSVLNGDQEDEQNIPEINEKDLEKFLGKMSLQDKKNDFEEEN